MQNCYWMPSSSLYCYPNINELPSLDTESSLNQLFGDGTGFICSPPRPDDFSDITSVKDFNTTPQPGSYVQCWGQLVPRSRSTWKTKPYSLLNQLRDLYHEEIRQNIHDIPEARTTCHLLSKLVSKEPYNMVVINLNPPGEGYTVSFQLENGKILEEEAKYPYTQDALLDYIDKQQLPTPFIEYWQHSVPQLFYDGCVICQVKDNRHGTPPEISYVLLKPHTQSLINDINQILMDSEQLWTPQEQFTIESNIINNSNRSLCLDPNPDIGRRLLKLHQDCHAFDNVSIRKLIERNSPLTLMRKRKYENLLPRSNPFLSDFIESKKSRPEFTEKTKPNLDVDIKLPMPRWMVSGKDILCEVIRSAKPLESKPESDDFTPRLIKEWILETNSCHVRLMILQRPVNFEYLCQIYMDNRYVEGKSTGSTCRFTLGSRDNAHRFVTQYIELYTAEGRQKVNITQLGPGQIIK